VRSGDRGRYGARGRAGVAGRASPAVVLAAELARLVELAAWCSASWCGSGDRGRRGARQAGAAGRAGPPGWWGLGERGRCGAGPAGVLVRLVLGARWSSWRVVKPVRMSDRPVQFSARRARHRTALIAEPVRASDQAVSSGSRAVVPLSRSSGQAGPIGGQAWTLCLSLNGGYST
jgi:hypothetical protein